MKHKVLIADDSLTIQKVIRITLSGESYHILDCDNISDLYEIVEAERPSLVFLDFALDESISGYEVCKKVQKLCSDSKVMLMFGTFDNVDDELLQKSGARAHIVKPFDGQKFITLCHSILEDQEFFGVESDDESLLAVERELENVNIELKEEEGDALDLALGEDDDEQTPAVGMEDGDSLEWEVDASGISSGISHDSLDLESSLVEDKPSSDDPLLDEDSFLEDQLSHELDSEWDMSVPSIIEDKGEENELLSSFNDDGELEADELIDFSNPKSTVWEEEIQGEIIENNEEEGDLVFRAVRDYMRTNGHKIIERVAWEVIPEISENIIKTEVKNIVEKVLEEKSKTS